jgi:autotransporter-associated beta strand protein
MRLLSLRHWVRGQSSRRRRSSIIGRRPSPRLHCEILEERLTPLTHTWTGLGANANWTTAANWDIGAPNSNDDVLIFPAGALRPTNTNNFGAGTTFQEVRLGGGFTISGNRLRLGTGGITNQAGTNLIQMDVELSNAATPINVAAGTLQVGNATAGAVSGTGGLIKSGSGRLILGRANTFGGVALVTAGELNVQNSAALGATSGFTAVQVGATLALQGNLNLGTEELRLGNTVAAGTLRNVSGTSTWAGAIRLNSTATIDVDSGQLTLSGVISSTAAGAGLTKEGTGTLVLAGGSSNTYSGVTTVNEGTLGLNKSAGVIPTAVPNGLVIGNASGIPRLGVETVRLLSQGAQTNGPVTINRSGRLDLNNFGAFYTALTINGGRLSIGTGLLGLLGDVTATSVQGSPAVIEGDEVLAVNTGGRFVVNNGPVEVDLLISAELTNNFQTTLTKDGPGRLELSAANTLTSPVVVTAGQLRISSATALGPADSAQTDVRSGATLEVIGNLTVAEPLILNGAGSGGLGALQSEGSNSVQAAVFNRTVTLTGNTTIRTDSNLTLSGVVSGNFNLTKIGPARLALNAANPNYGGLTTIQEGSLAFFNAQGLGSAAGGDGTIVQAGASLLAPSGTIAEPLTLSGAGAPGVGAALFGSGGPVFTGPITLTGNTSLAAAVDNSGGGGAFGSGGGGGGGSLNLAGSISGPFEVTITNGFVTFSGATANTHGSTRIVGGILTLAKSANTTAIPGALLLGDGSTGAGQVVVQNAEQIANTAPVTLNLFSAVLLVQANETIGPLTINDNNDNSVSGISTSGGATLTLSADVNVTGRGSFLGAIALGGATRTFTVAAGGTLDVGGTAGSTLSGGGGLIKAGAGRLHLRGTNSYAGPTSVNAGTLFVGQALASPVTVNSGATLTGNAQSILSLGGPFSNITSAGGTVNPGNNPNAPALGGGFNGPPSPAGILLSNGAVTFNAATTFRVDIGGTTPGQTGHDQLNLVSPGTLNLGNAELEIAFAGGFQSAVGNTYTIIKNDTNNATNGLFTNAAGQVIAQGGTIDVPVATTNGASPTVRFRINYSGGDFNDVVLTHESTPTQAEDLALTPTVLDEGETTVLTGNLTDPDELDELTLTINWGDGTPVQEFRDTGRDPFRVPHQYLDDGLYTVSVGWRDQHGGGRSQDFTVLVRNVAPTVLAGGDATIAAGTPLQRTVSFADPGSDAWRAVVVFGDGSSEVVTAIQNRQFELAHRYDRAGTYQVFVFVLDDDGGAGVETFTVTVTNPGTGQGGGGGGDDGLSGGDGTDVLRGDAGNDHLDGGAGSNTRITAEGREAIGKGNDHLDGRAGSNPLIGGVGEDYDDASDGELDYLFIDLVDRWTRRDQFDIVFEL